MPPTRDLGFEQAPSKHHQLRLRTLVLVLKKELFTVLKSALNCLIETDRLPDYLSFREVVRRPGR